MVSDKDFLTLNGTKYTVPTQPVNPVVSRTSAAAIKQLPFTTAEAMRKYDHQSHDFEVYRIAKGVLRTTILSAVDKKYICRLKHRRTLYARVDPFNIIKHL